MSERFTTRDALAIITSGRTVLDSERAQYILLYELDGAWYEHGGIDANVPAEGRRVWFRKILNDVKRFMEEDL